MSYYKNTKLFSLYKVLSGAIIIGPIITIYLLNVKGLDFKQIMLLSSFGALSLVLFEVPTGAIADYFSRKISLFIGSLIIALSLVAYILASNFWGCLVAEVLFGLGFAFTSGADTALLYDSLLNMKRESDFQRIAGYAHSRLLWVQAVGSLAAGFLYDYNAHLPLIISFIFVTLSSFIAILFKEPHIVTDKITEKETYIEQIKRSVKFTVTHTKVKALILYISVFFMFYRMGFFLFQPYMVEVGLSAKYIGIMFFLFNITAAITSKNSHKIIKLTKKRTLTCLSLLMILSFMLMGLTKVWVGSFAILLQQMARGLYTPITRKYLNKHISSDIRSTVLSLISLITRLLGSMVYPLLGILKDNTNVFYTHIVLAITMSVLTYLVMLYLKDKLGAKAQEIKTAGLTP